MMTPNHSFLSPFGSKSQSLAVPWNRAKWAKETRTKSGQEVRASGSGLFKETSIGEHEKALDCFFQPRCLAY